LPESHVIERPFSFADGRIGLRHLMSADPPPTAIICGNDVLALGALFEALAVGIKVPEQLSIVGFDGLELGQHTSPGLTTVDVHCAEIGSRTAEVLLNRLSGRPVPKATRIELDLVVRGSSGPAPTENHS
jgi:LacI family transcriptional regulator